MQGTERSTTGPYKAVRRLIGVRGVLTIPYEAYNALLKLQAPTIQQPILLMVPTYYYPGWAMLYVPIRNNARIWEYMSMLLLDIADLGSRTKHQ